MQKRQIDGPHLHGEEPEYLGADAGDDVVTDGEGPVGVCLPQLHELLPELLAHLPKRDQDGRVKRKQTKEKYGIGWPGADRSRSNFRETR